MTRSLRTNPPAMRAARRAGDRVNVHVVPARAGFIHPATRRDIEELLEFFAPLAIYGLRSVELRQSVDGGGRVLIARLHVPGSVVLYEQRRPPWVIRGLSVGSLERLRRAGAVLDVVAGVARVEWPGETLRDLVLFDGLMHEIGHHLVQHHRGKRTLRVMRTADHERYAEAFAAACRMAWGRTPKSRVSAQIHLVGDGIERPANARAMMDAAAMFQTACAFRDTCGLAARWLEERGGTLPLVESARLLDELLPIVAVENTPGATPIYEAVLPPGQPSIVVGGERRGVSGDVLRTAARCIEIPMTSRRVNTLNVAAAAAVTLFYLTGGRRHAARQSAQPELRRPALLLLGPGDHVEAGSTIRSAAALGWRTVGLDDRRCVWFGAPRAAIAEGRAAARSHRNAIRVAPMPATGHLGFDRVVIAGARVHGPPLHRTDLTGGRSTLLVVPDEEVISTADWQHLGHRIDVAQVPLPVTTFPYRYRLVASIVLAEAARQIGVPAGARPRPIRRRSLSYESAIDTAAAAPADVVTFEQLRAY